MPRMASTSASAGQARLARLLLTRMFTCQMVGTGSLAQQLHEAEQRFGPIGVAGVYGVGEVIVPSRSGTAARAERHRLGRRSRTRYFVTGPSYLPGRDA